MTNTLGCSFQGVGVGYLFVGYAYVWGMVRTVFGVSAITPFQWSFFMVLLDCFLGLGFGATTVWDRRTVAYCVLPPGFRQAKQDNVKYGIDAAFVSPESRRRVPATLRVCKRTINRIRAGVGCQAGAVESMLVRHWFAVAHFSCHVGAGKLRRNNGKILFRCCLTPPVAALFCVLIYGFWVKIFARSVPDKVAVAQARTIEDKIARLREALETSSRVQSRRAGTAVIAVRVHSICWGTEL